MILATVQAAPAPQFATLGATPLGAYSGFGSAYSPFNVYNSGYYNPYNTAGYSGFAVGGLSPYGYY